MSGLGSSTLLLRLGAVINLSKKLSEKDYDDDALLIKRIIENLKETLPTDTNWKNIWQITCYKESEWSKYVFSKKGEHSLIEKFIIFRNKFVHGFITIQVENSKELFSGLNILHKICTDLSSLFVETQLKEINGKYYFIKNDKKIELYPFVQKGSLDGLPYIFQGIKKNKKSAELINSFFGNIELQDDNEHYEKFFIPMIELLKGGAGKIFDHKRRIDYYNECFVGRDNETSEVLEWANSSNSQNVLPIFSSAGMGKGAFVANLITKLKEDYGSSTIN